MEIKNQAAGRTENYEGKYKIDRTTLEEVWKEYDAGFSFYASECYPNRFPEGYYPWHWHEYVQFFYVLKGEITYQLLDGTHIFREGEGGFINSNALHTLKNASGGNPLMIEELLYPTFIGGIEHNDIMAKYVLPVSGDESFAMFRLEKDVPEHQNILRLLQEMYRLYTDREEGFELQIHARISLLWADFYRLTKDRRQAIHADVSSTGRLKAMMLYITEHFADKITLDEIAAAGTCSRRECNRTFQTRLKLTPFQYLSQIRMNKAVTMLRNTNIPITELAENCGFSDSSHFTKAFRAEYGVTPRQYRTGNIVVPS